MKKIMIFMVGLLLISLNVFADDVSIDSSGNVKTGVASSGNLEVTGASAEKAIVGQSSGTGGAGMYGINNTSGNYGILGYDTYGVFGYSLSGWAGYFQGNTRITGNLTVDGSLIGPMIGDITAVNAGTGLSGGGTSGDVTLSVNTTTIQQRVTGTCAAGSSIRTVNANGTVVCEPDDVGIAAETDPTVPANVKDGIDWTELSGIPAGFADGIDNTGADSLWVQSGSNIYYNTGNVGIGTSAPDDQLEITGNLRLPVTTQTTGIIKSGWDTLIHTYGGGNFFAGINAGNLSMSGYYNTASGHYALGLNNTGYNNTANGYIALYSNTTGHSNTAIGSGALFSNSTGLENTANGYNALYSNTEGYYNTATGTYALSSNTTGIVNTATGHSSLKSNTTGINNTAYGYNALFYNTTGRGNIAAGVQALYNNDTGWENTAAGEQALYYNTTGDYNTATGAWALSSNVGGYYNTAIGFGANVTSGYLTNATALGSGAYVNASNKVRIGNSSVTVIEGQVAFSYPSDLRIKKDIEDIGYGLEFVKQLRPVQYRLKEGNDRTDFGFIAQDIEALLGTEFNVLSIGEDEERMLSLRYTDLIAPLVKAIQEQQQIIDSQQARIEQLEQQQSQIDELKRLVEELKGGL